MFLNSIENFRVGQKTDYEKLVIEIVTDGTLSPYTAINDSANILMQHLEVFLAKNILYKPLLKK